MIKFFILLIITFPFVTHTMEMQESNTTHITCSICQEDYETEDPKITFSCHQFHQECFMPWAIKNKQRKLACPLCKKDISSKQPLG